MGIDYDAFLSCGIAWSWSYWKELIPLSIYFDGRHILFEEKPNSPENATDPSNRKNKRRKFNSVINCNIDSIPVDVLKLIFGFRVCKEWYRLLKSTASWPQSQIEYARDLIVDCRHNDEWMLIDMVAEWVELNYGDHLFVESISPYYDADPEERVLSECI
jgi:hypothetical protein